MDETIISFRIDRPTKAAFERIANELDLTTSQMLRQYIRRIISDHARVNAQGELALSEPKVTATPATDQKPQRPKKGQRMAHVKPANWRPK